MMSKGSCNIGEIITKSKRMLFNEPPPKYKEESSETSKSYTV